MKSRHDDLINGYCGDVDEARLDTTSTAYIRYVANAFARVPTSFFLPLRFACQLLDYKNRASGCPLCTAVLLIVNAPALGWCCQTIFSRTRELSFTKPSDWLLLITVFIVFEVVLMLWWRIIKKI